MAHGQDGVSEEMALLDRPSATPCGADVSGLLGRDPGGPHGEAAAPKGLWWANSWGSLKRMGRETPGPPSTQARGERAEKRLARLRSSAEPESESSLFVVTLRIRIPLDIWTGPFSNRHRTLRMEALNRTDLNEETSVSDYWISGGAPGVWANEIASYPDVVRVESLAEVADGCLYRVTYRNPPVIYTYRRLQLPMQFPLRMQDGVITWEVIGRRSDFEEVLQFARRRASDVRVVSIRRRPLRSHLPLLSEAQHRLLTDAMAAGYFAVPRAITLTDLARKLGRSKSSTSEALALIEKKLLESALRPSELPS